MALKATINKVSLSLSDMDNHKYQDYSFTVAQHPSETDQRMMLRILAFALNANEQLEFTKGLCADDEPELWQKSLSDEIELWIELGLPDEKRIKKACNRAEQVLLYTYGEGDQSVWLDKNQNKLHNYSNLTCISIKANESQQLATLAARSMRFTVTIQDGQVWINSDDTSVMVEPIVIHTSTN